MCICTHPHTVQQSSHTHSDLVAILRHTDTQTPTQSHALTLIHTQTQTRSDTVARQSPNTHTTTHRHSCIHSVPHTHTHSLFHPSCCDRGRSLRAFAPRACGLCKARIEKKVAFVMCSRSVATHGMFSRCFRAYLENTSKTSRVLYMLAHIALLSLLTQCVVLRTWSVCPCGCVCGGHV